MRMISRRQSINGYRSSCSSDGSRDPTHPPDGGRLVQGFTARIRTIATTALGGIAAVTWWLAGYC